MRSGIVLAAAASLFGASAPAASQTHPPSTIASVMPVSAARPQLGRRLGQSVWHAMVMGSFIDKTGKYHQLTGEGDFFPTFGPSSTQMRFSVQLMEVGGDKIDFGTLQGNGLSPGGGGADHARFDVSGVPNENGYQLNVLGSFVSGYINGSFELVGNGGLGAGEFAGHP